MHQFEVMLMFPFVFQGHGRKMLGYLLVQRMWLARLRENSEAELMGQFSELRQQVFRRSPEVGEPALHSLISVVKSVVIHGCLGCSLTEDILTCQLTTFVSFFYG